MSKHLDLDIDTMQDVYMSRDQRAAYQRIVNDARMWHAYVAATSAGQLELLDEAWKRSEELRKAHVSNSYKWEVAEDVMALFSAPTREDR